jgi:hypothetical protein
MRKLFALAVMCACAAIAQDRYVVSGAATIGASDYTVTIRQPASGGKRMEVETVAVQSVGGEITAALERDCTGVTTTTPLSIVAVNPETTPVAGAAQQAYANSAATGCTPLNDFGATHKGWKIGDRALLPIPAQGTFKEGSGVTRNINLRLTGNGYVALYQIIVRISR